MGTGADRERSDLTVHLQRLYQTRFPDAEQRSRTELWQVLCRHFFQRMIPAEATVLDLGAGGAEFINNINARRRIAVDANPSLAARVNPGVEALVCPFEELADHLEPASIDVCFASNVFEHLKDAEQLVRTLETIRLLLRTGGSLIILQPNIRAVGASFWDFIDHTLPLTERGMVEALNVAGFTIEVCRSRFLPYTTRSRLPSWPWLVRAYLRLRPVHWLLGGQMLITARAGSS